MFAVLNLVVYFVVTLTSLLALNCLGVLILINTGDVMLRVWCICFVFLNGLLDGWVLFNLVGLNLLITLGWLFVMWIWFVVSWLLLWVLCYLLWFGFSNWMFFLWFVLSCLYFILGLVVCVFFVAWFIVITNCLWCFGIWIGFIVCLILG